MEEIPVVDILPIMSNGVSDGVWMDVAKDFQQALRTSGFTYVINHGIPGELVQSAFDTSKAFFSQPPEIKEKYGFDSNRSYHGYTHRPVELDGRGTYDVRECFDCAGINRFYPNAEVPLFSSAIEELEQRSKTLLQTLLRLLAKSLDIKDDLYFVKACKYLDDSSVPSCSTFRTLFYPGIREEIELIPGALRTNEHTDYGIITLLFQDMIGGLEVKSISGNWIPVVPKPNAVLINTGDLLQFWTGRLIPATPHRVLIPEDKQKRKLDRQSIAYFVQPDENYIIAPIQSKLVTYQTEFEPISTLKYVTQKLQRVY